MNSAESLKEWMVHYLQNKDIVARNITSIEQDSNGFDIIVHSKTGDHFILIRPKLQNIEEINTKADSRKTSIVVLNSKENLDFVIKYWNVLIKHPALCIYFVNLHSQTETKWAICPQIHNLITEKKALKKGLVALFSTVEKVKT